MMSDFTKGKWKDIGDGVIIASDGRQVCSIFTRDREANAHLIAAAPDMYEALKLIYFGMPEKFANAKFLKDKAHKALAKAEED